MLIEILARTPLWVFAFFFALLALGIVQSRTRQFNRNKVWMLPVAMILFSFYGVVSAFGVVFASRLARATGILRATRSS